MMIHYLEDNNKEAKAFIDSEDSELFVSVCIGDKQYDFGLDERELELIRFLINQNNRTMSKAEDYILENMESGLITGWDDKNRPICHPWLKSLHPQKQWKPTEEQLTCLEDAVNSYHKNGHSAKHLTSLLCELKAL